jgi:PAS domain S-box-containing protein
MIIEKALTEFFRISSTPSLVLLNDAPKFTIVEVNNAYLETTFTNREYLLGKGIFEAFPENENDPQSDGFKNFTASLTTVIETKKSHKMAIQKHDICIEGNSKFEVKYWKVENIPLVDEYDKVQFIVHAVADVSEKVLSNIKTKEAHLMVDKGNELLQQTENISKLGRWEIDRTTNKAYWSNNHYIMLGYEPQEFEITLEKTIELIYHEDREMMTAHFEHVLKELKDYKIEFRLTAKNNSVINVVTRGTFVFDKDGKLLKQVGVVQDVTDVKTAEAAAKKAIAESNERFEYVTKATFDAIWDWDLATDTLFWGEGFETIFGHKIASLACNSSSWTNNIHPEDLQRVIDSFYIKIKSSATNWTEEYRYKKGNGEYSDVINKGIITRGEDFRAKRIIGAMQDVTKQKAEVQHLKLLESVITNATDSVLITEAEPFDYPGPKILFVNEAFTKMTGYTAEEVIGKTPRILRGPKTDIEEIKKLSNAIQRWESCEATLLNYKKNGEEFWVNMAISPIANEKGTFTHWIAIERDVTERINQEHKLAEINQKLFETLESIQDGFYTLDADWNISFWNKEAERISGKSHQDMIGLNIWNFYEGQISEQIHVKFLEAKEQNKPVRLEIYSKQLEKWFEINAFPSTSGLTVYFKDITDRKQVESKIKKMNRKLEVNIKKLAISNQELEQFAYVASHDLQEPLRMVTGFLTQIENRYNDILDDKGKKYIYFAVDGAKRMRQIILDLLEFSRIGKHDITLEEINLNEILSETCLLFGKKMEEKNAKIIYETLPKILNYSAPIKQIFHNLIGNGLKYSDPNRSPIITISSHETANSWKFVVQDNGIGIEAEYFEKIFIIFQRLHNKEEYSGTGIGLAITKKIIENLGGQIWVTSEEGVGSDFHFTIPKKQTRKA